MLARLPRSTMKRTLLVLKLVLVSFLVFLSFFGTDLRNERIFDPNPSGGILEVGTADKQGLEQRGADLVYIDTEDVVSHQLSGRELKSISVLVLQPWSSPSQSLQDEAERFLSYINTPQIKCKDVRDVGKDYIPDGMKNTTWPWKVCFDPEVKVTASQGHWEDTQCLVYSFGAEPVNRGFEIEMTELGCEVHTFIAPQRKLTTTQSTDTGRGQLVFHRTSLGWRDSMMTRQRDSQWRTRKLIGILDDLGHQQVDILRADLGSSEWKVLENIVADGTVKRIHQLLLKIHVHWSGFEVTGTDAGIVRYWYSLLKRLENHGFMLFSVTRDNESPQRFLGKEQFNASCCYTLSWVNTRWNDDGL